MSEDDIDIQVKGKIDLTQLDARDNGLVVGEGTGGMTMILRSDSGEIMRVRLHKITFEGTKQTTEPDRYPDSTEK